MTLAACASLSGVNTEQIDYLPVYNIGDYKVNQLESYPLSGFRWSQVDQPRHYPD